MTGVLVPMLVRAKLAAGIAHAAPWGIALDGLLVAQMWAQHKEAARLAGAEPPRALEVANPPDLDLPLDRCETGDGTWHWTATCAYPEDEPAHLPPEVRYWTGRVDHRALEHLTSALPSALSERQGRYRARRMPLLVTTCSTITWHAIGDPNKVRDLLANVTAIGKKRSHGEGHVLAWEITPQPSLDPFAAAHLYPDGTLGRPAPAACLSGRDVVDGGISTAGLRPPYMHPCRQHTVHLPAPLDT